MFSEHSLAEQAKETMPLIADLVYNHVSVGDTPAQRNELLSLLLWSVCDEIRENEGTPAVLDTLNEIIANAKVIRTMHSLGGAL